MSGRKGRSGRRPLPVQEALLRGVYRPERHGALALNVAIMPTPTSAQGQALDAGWSPSRADLLTLGPKGVRFVKQWIAIRESDPREALIALFGAETDRWRGHRVRIRRQVVTFADRKTGEMKSRFEKVAEDPDVVTPFKADPFNRTGEFCDQDLDCPPSSAGATEKIS